MKKPFEGISEKNKQKLLRFLEANTLHYKANKSILSTMSKDDMIGIIISGYIQITRIDVNGNRMIIEEIEEDEIFGTSISSLKNSEIEILTKEETDLIIIDYQTLLNMNLKIGEFYTKFIKNLLEIITNKMEEKNERIGILVQKTTRNKLLEYFNIMAKKEGQNHIYLPFTFTDLADYLAVDRCAMTRELKYLKEEGFIEIKGKKIILLYDR